MEARDANVPNALNWMPKYLGNQCGFFGHGKVRCPGTDHRDCAANRGDEFMPRGSEVNQPRSGVPPGVGKRRLNSLRFCLADAGHEPRLLCVRQAFKNGDNVVGFLSLAEDHLGVTCASEPVRINGGDCRSSVHRRRKAVDGIGNREFAGLHGMQKVLEFLIVHGGRLTHKAVAVIRQECETEESCL